VDIPAQAASEADARLLAGSAAAAEAEDDADEGEQE
jgi:hypothetical protein